MSRYCFKFRYFGRFPMANDRILKLQKNRFSFLRHLYETTKGRRDVMVSLFEIAAEIGIDKGEEGPLADYLEGEGLLDFVTLQGNICITHEGIIQVEKALTQPDKATDYFPPVNVIHVETMNNSQIQQATIESIQVFNLNENKISAIEKFLGDLRKNTAELDLGKDLLSELEAEMSTIDAQINSPKPKSGILKATLLSIKTILEGAAGSVIASQLIEQLSSIL